MVFCRICTVVRIGPKRPSLTHFHSNGCQARSRAKMVRCRCDRLVHGDAPPNESFFGSSLAREHRPSFGKLFKGWQTCRYFGRNLGSYIRHFIILLLVGLWMFELALLN